MGGSKIIYKNHEQKLFRAENIINQKLDKILTNNF